MFLGVYVDIRMQNTQQALHIGDNDIQILYCINHADCRKQISRIRGAENARHDNAKLENAGTLKTRHGNY